MRIEVPEIYWHGNKERIMSIDFFPFTSSLSCFQNKIVFVTGGTDSESQAFIKVHLLKSNGKSTPRNHPKIFTLLKTMKMKTNLLNL